MTSSNNVARALVPAASAFVPTLALPFNQTSVETSLDTAGTTARATSQKGGALLAVLWMSAALAAIAFSVSTTVRGEIDRVASDTDGLRAHYLATGSVERAIQWMLWGGDYRNPDGTPK